MEILGNIIGIGLIMILAFLLFLVVTTPSPARQRSKELRRKLDNISDRRDDHELYDKAAGIAWATTSARTSGRYPTLQHFDAVEAEIIALSEQCRTAEGREDVLRQLGFVHSSRDMAQLRGTPYHTKDELKTARDVLDLPEKHEPQLREKRIADARRRYDPKALKKANAPAEVQKEAAERLAAFEAAYAVLLKEEAETYTWDDVFNGEKEIPQTKRS